MPWSDYSNNVRDLSGFIQWAVQNGYRTTDVTSAARDIWAALGVKASFQDYTNLAQLYGQHSRSYQAAVSFQSAVTEVQRTGIDQAITGNMIQPMPWSPSLSDWQLNPRIGADVQYTIDTPFGPETHYFTINLQASDLQSVGGFMDDAQLGVDISDTESPPSDATLTGFVRFRMR